MKLVEHSVDGFLRELASESPAPGGGSVAALAGALAASLCCMVCRLTLARKKLEAAWPDMREALGCAEVIGARLRGLVDEDSDAYNAVVAAHRLPRATPAESEQRDRAIAKAVMRAARTPLETLEAVSELAPVVERVAEKGNPSCITDIGSAASLLRAAAASAAMNVRINLPGVADSSARDRLAETANAALADVERRAQSVERVAAERIDHRSTP